MAQTVTHLLSVPSPFGDAGASDDVYKIVLSGGATTASVNVGKRVVFAQVVQHEGANFPDVDIDTTPGTVAIGGNVAAGADKTLHLFVKSLGN